MKNFYRVLIARLTYDEFHVTAESPKEAAKLAARGKVREFKTNVSWDHDAIFDVPGTVTVLSNELDSAGFCKKLYTCDDEGD